MAIMNHHILWSQSSPCHPFTQLHSFGWLHDPLTHPILQIAKEKEKNVRLSFFPSNIIIKKAKKWHTGSAKISTPSSGTVALAWLSTCSMRTTTCTHCWVIGEFKFENEKAWKQNRKWKRKWKMQTFVTDISFPASWAITFSSSIASSPTSSSAN